MPNNKLGYNIRFIPAHILLKMNGKSLTVASMVATTLMVAVLVTFVPQLIPIWMGTAN